MFGCVRQFRPGQGAGAATGDGALRAGAAPGAGDQRFSKRLTATDVSQQNRLNIPKNDTRFFTEEEDDEAIDQGEAVTKDVKLRHGNLVWTLGMRFQAGRSNYLLNWKPVVGAGRAWCSYIECGAIQFDQCKCFCGDSGSSYMVAGLCQRPPSFERMPWWFLYFSLARQQHARDISPSGSPTGVVPNTNQVHLDSRRAIAMFRNEVHHSRPIESIHDSMLVCKAWNSLISHNFSRFYGDQLAVMVFFTSSTEVWFPFSKSQPSFKLNIGYDQICRSLPAMASNGLIAGWLSESPSDLFVWNPLTNHHKVFPNKETTKEEFIVDPVTRNYTLWIHGHESDNAMVYKSETGELRARLTMQLPSLDLVIYTPCIYGSVNLGD
ncbi:hypothetical protein SELMODRAFT_413150 [Selaginella moellendorffii]|uniref:F-box domain-containing protein n=1 Tax=Selaginella moellendorffii TaxID=88036 RepID=D8RNI2_SELML|nr:hypothetical protein SELMODRAFT_413150 [Selaginella moellendorffii]